MTMNHVLSTSAFGAGLPFADFNFASLAGVGRAFPGMVTSFQGNLYQVVQNRAGGNLVVGEAVSLSVGAANMTGNSTAASTKAVLTTDDTHDSGLRGDRSNPGLVGVTAGALATTADMEVREILGNTPVTSTSTIVVSEYDSSLGPVNGVATSGPTAFTALPDASSDYVAFCPWEVVKSDVDAVATSMVQGIVVSTVITDNYFGVIQVKGLALAIVNGTTDLAAGDYLIPSGTAGELVKHVVTHDAAAQVGTEIFGASLVCGRILAAYTDGNPGKRLIQLFGNLAHIPYPITD